MSKITVEDVQKIALLSRLKLTETEVEMFRGQLGDIIDYIEKLSEVDITGVEPFINAASEGNVFRNDVLREEAGNISNEQATQNAPQKGDGFFKVPATIATN